MRRLFAAIIAITAVLTGNPAWAVLKSAILTVTDQGQAIPGATLALSRPRPRVLHRKAQRTTERTRPPSTAQPYQPAEAQAQPNWLVARTGPGGEVHLQFDDRDAPPGSLIDIVLYYPNGEMRRRLSVPIETILAGGLLEMSGPPPVPAGYDGPPPGAYYQPGPAPYYGPMPPPPPVETLPGALPNVGVGFEFGGRGGNFEGRRGR